MRGLTFAGWALVWMFGWAAGLGCAAEGGPVLPADAGGGVRPPDSGAGDAGQAQDSGPRPDAGGLPDAGSAPDAGAVDAGSIDAGSPTIGPARITLAFRGELAAGLPVVFRGVSGRVLEVVRTDATGTAEALVEAGGSITAVYDPGTGLASVYDFLGVKPGDHLRVGRPDPAFTQQRVSLPAVAPSDARYWALARCGGVQGRDASTELTMRLLPGCTRADVFVSARQPRRPYADYGAFVARDVDLTGPVDVVGFRYAPASPVALRLTGTTADLRFADSWLFATTPTLGFWVSASSGESIGRYERPLTPSATATASIPTIDASEMLVETRMGYAGPSGHTATFHVIDRVPVARAYALDTSSLPVPLLSEPATVSASGEIRWGEAGGAAPQWVRGYFRSDRGAGRFIDRSVVAPHSGIPVLQLPALPPELDELNPTAADAYEQRFFLVGVSPGGYDGYRQHDRSDDRSHLRATGDRFAVAGVLP